MLLEALAVEVEELVWSQMAELVVGVVVDSMTLLKTYSGLSKLKWLFARAQSSFQQ